MSTKEHAQLIFYVFFLFARVEKQRIQKKILSNIILLRERKKNENRKV